MNAQKAYFDDILEKADKLSSKALEGGKWDTEAFLVQSMVMLLKQNTKDDIEETTIDDSILDINGLFARYYQSRSLENLGFLLSKISMMLCELYHLCDTQEEKALFKANMIVCREDI